MPNPLDVGLLGLGGVAQGLLELWSETPDPRFRIAWALDTTGRVEAPLGLSAGSLLAAKRRGDLARLAGARFTPGASLRETLATRRADVVLDLLPCDYAPTNPLPAELAGLLEAGVHVVTAEKASLVLAFERLRAAARDAGVWLRYSACVGGSVPFIPFLEWVSGAHPIRRVQGVLNATTTFLLSELEARRAAAPEVLDRARRLGILERDARLDIDGLDLAAKALIVHNTIYGQPLPWTRVQPRGIRPHIDHATDVAPGTRLVADVRPGDVRVDLQRLPMDSPLRVYGLENALLVDTRDAGELFVRGTGAGGRGTATNVYGDLVRIAESSRGGEPDATPRLPPRVLHAHL